MIRSRTWQRRFGRNRRSFTLTELLVSIIVITVLASMILFAMSEAQQAARKAQTEATIRKLHSLIMEMYQSYTYERVPPNFTFEVLEGQNYLNRELTAEAHALFRLDSLRRLMRMEMPDHYEDLGIAWEPGNPWPSGTALQLQLLDGTFQAFFFQPAIHVPALYDAGHPNSTGYLTGLYQAHFDAVFDSVAYLDTQIGTGTGSGDEKKERLIRFQSAELLYMTVMHGTLDREVHELFSDREIGDLDDDNNPEFLDGWGRPIRWLRWAPGVVSPLQQPRRFLDRDPSSGQAIPILENNQQGTFPLNPDYRSDPMDFLELTDSTRVTESPRLVPYIYSAGPDGVTDIVNSILIDSPSDDQPEFWSPPVKLYPYKDSNNNNRVVPVQTLGTTHGHAVDGYGRNNDATPINPAEIFPADVTIFSTPGIDSKIIVESPNETPRSPVYGDKIPARRPDDGTLIDDGIEGWHDNIDNHHLASN